MTTKKKIVVNPRREGKSLQMFQFLRGAIRSSYGIEDFREKTFLIVGMCDDALELLNRLCIDGAILRFEDSSLEDYHKSFAICHSIDVHDDGPADIVINFNRKYIIVKGKSFSINDDAYIQGVHEFYL